VSRGARYRALAAQVVKGAAWYRRGYACRPDGRRWRFVKSFIGYMQLVPFGEDAVVDEAW
jgi:hypothetical protein